MTNNFMQVTFYKRPAPYMGPRVEYEVNLPMIWDQTSLEQEPEWKGTIIAFGATHGTVDRDELTRELAKYGGTRKQNMEVLALAKGIGTDWTGKYVTHPK